VATILSLNGAKNNPKIVTKITAVRPKEGFPQGLPLNTPLFTQAGRVLWVVKGLTTEASDSTGSNFSQINGQPKSKYILRKQDS